MISEGIVGLLLALWVTHALVQYALLSGLKEQIHLCRHQVAEVHRQLETRNADALLLAEAIRDERDPHKVSKMINEARARR